MGVVYLLVHRSGKRFKIGRSSNIKQRVSSLGGPSEFSLSESFAIHTDHPKETERCLHFLFRDANISARKKFDGYTEWFEIETLPKVISFIEGQRNLLGYIAIESSLDTYFGQKLKPKSFFACAALGENDRLTEFLNDGTCPNFRYKDQRTALMMAASYGREDAVRLLVGRGAEIGLQDVWGNTALIYAAAKGHGGILDFLLENGANPDVRNKDTSLKLMAPPGGGALHYAVMSKSERCVLSLLDAGADVDIRDDFDCAPQDYAKKLRLKIIEELLLLYSDSNFKEDMKRLTFSPQPAACTQTLT